MLLSATRAAEDAPPFIPLYGGKPTRAGRAATDNLFSFATPSGSASRYFAGRKAVAGFRVPKRW